MSFSLLPAIVANAVTDLTAELLHSHGIRLLMLDFDNTLVPYTTDIPTKAVVDWLNAMSASDISLCVVSNSKNSRVKNFCKAYGLDCITHARKPFPKGICQCLQRYGVPRTECALVGDQIYTDTLGANCAGIRSILVRAIDNHNIWLKARHVAELPFIFASMNRRIYK